MSEGLFANPVTWIAIAFFLLIGLLYKKIAAILANTLDARSAKIAEELSTARRLREEAEEVLAMYKKKQAEYAKEAEAILKKAREDADHAAALADKELKHALDARTENALEKIAQEEAKAISDVRAHVVDISLAAAKTVIMKHIETTPHQDLMKLALADIDRKIH
jgi:F-type H+-transporting ATPase subunit b